MLGKDKARLRHILESIELIEEYLAHISKANYFNDRKLQDAISRRLEIIGEATKVISQTTRQKYPEVPWKEMAGMRDKLTHEYFGVDMEITLGNLPRRSIWLKGTGRKYFGG